jgi:hypothetical protein
LISPPNRYLLTSSFGIVLKLTRVKDMGKRYGIKKPEVIGNLMGTKWELHGNTLATTKGGGWEEKIPRCKEDSLQP